MNQIGPCPSEEDATRLFIGIKVTVGHLVLPIVTVVEPRTPRFYSRGQKTTKGHVPDLTLQSHWLFTSGGEDGNL